MTVIHRSALVEYSVEHMFDIVNDIEQYPQFMQGCISAKVKSQSEHELIGEGMQALLLTFFAIPATMSLGISDFFTNFTSYGGLSKSFFDLVSDVFYETILPFVGFTVCIFCAYRWKVSGLKSELVIGDDDYDGSLLEKYVNFSLGTIIPVVLLVVFISTVFQIYLN